MPSRLSRRRFLQATAASLGTAGLAPLVLRSDEKKVSPNERLRVGVIGVAAQGQYNWGEIAKVPSAEVVALCDVHETRIGPARKAFPNATFDTDFRKMLDRKGLDAVVVATPDHTHAVATLAALRAGLHVYCEKPLTHSVHEARLVAETAKKMKRVTQMGTQIHAGNNYRRVVEIVQAGAIGPVSEVHVWVGTSYGGGDRPKETEPVLTGLDWDLWIGPAPERPFHHGTAADKRGTYVPFNWRKWWDFGGGALADMACHFMDLPFWALKLRYPTKVSADGTKLSSETSAEQLTVKYEFPARDDLPAVKLTWYDGGRRPDLLKEAGLAPWGNGVLFVGTKGMLIADYGKFKLLPEKEFAGFEPPKPSIPNSVGHHREWVEACVKGGTTTCNFDYSGALTEAVLLGNVSYRCGQPLEWDPNDLKAKNAPESERFIRKEYRKGWSV